MEDFSDTSYDDTVTELPLKGTNGSSSVGATLAGIAFDPAPGFHTLVQDPETHLDRLNELFLFITESGLYFREDNLAELAMVAAKASPLKIQSPVAAAKSPESSTSNDLTF